MREAQQAEPKLAMIIKFLSQDVLPEDNKQADWTARMAQHYELIDQVLYRKANTFRYARRQERKLRVVLPQSLRAIVLEECHDMSASGHLGIKQTLARIEENYYWEGMYEDVRKYVTSCIACITKKMTPHKNIGELGTIVASRPWEIIGSDMLGPLPLTAKGNRYILTFTDHFTKWVEAFAIKSCTAGEVAQHFVESIICRFGTPDKLLTDRGKAFIGELMTEVNKLLQVRYLRTSPYHPQTNRLTECFNKTLTTMLSMYVGAHQKDWDVYIPYVLLAY